jgi:hypothetical protein
MATSEMFNRLPKLDDDDDIGIEKEHIVPSDDEADLKFKGVLLASVASDPRGQGRWREYRVYCTAARRYVFAKVGRSLLDNERDKFEAKVWEPLSACEGGGFQTRVLRELPLPFDRQLAGALVEYFKFDPLAKQLYAKLDVDTTQRIA